MIRCTFCDSPAVCSVAPDGDPACEGCRQVYDPTDDVCTCPACTSDAPGPVVCYQTRAHDRPTQLRSMMGPDRGANPVPIQSDPWRELLSSARLVYIDDPDACSDWGRFVAAVDALNAEGV